MSGLGRRITELPAISAGIELLERHDDRGVVRRDRGDDADRLVTADAQRDPSARRARRPAPGSTPRASSTGRGRSSSAAERRRRSRSCVASANIVGCPASATIVATSAAPFASTWSRSACRTAGPLGGAASTAHGPSSNARRASAMARWNSATRRDRQLGDLRLVGGVLDRRAPRRPRPTGRPRTTALGDHGAHVASPFRSGRAGGRSVRTTFYLSRNVLARNPRRHGHGITPASCSSPIWSQVYPSSSSTISECSPCSGARRSAGGRSSNCTGTVGSRYAGSPSITTSPM